VGAFFLPPPAPTQRDLARARFAAAQGSPALAHPFGRAAEGDAIDVVGIV